MRGKKIISTAKLKSEFWVQAYKKLLENKGVPIYLVKKGEEEAGAIIIKVSNLNGAARLYVRVTGSDYKFKWELIDEDSEPKIDNRVEKQVTMDPDCWVLEIEEKTFKHYLVQFI